MFPPKNHINHIIVLVIVKTEELRKDMKFIGQMARVKFITSLGEDNVLQLKDFDVWFLFLVVSVKNQNQRDRSTGEYLSQLDKKTRTALIEVYKKDFEMFQYNIEEY